MAVSKRDLKQCLKKWICSTKSVAYIFLLFDYKKKVHKIGIRKRNTLHWDQNSNFTFEDP